MPQSAIGPRIMPRPEIEAELVKKGKYLLAQGMGIATIARRLNVGTDWIRRRIDPEWAEHKRHVWRKQYLRNTNNTVARRSHVVTPGPDFALVRKLMAEIPEDTRDYTARHFGDPLPGRSALDRRGRGHEGHN